MIGHLRALKAHLSNIGAATVVIGDATGTRPPFIALSAGDRRQPRDMPYAGLSRGEYTLLVDATCTAQTVDASLQVAQAVVERVTPDGDPAELPGVPGRRVTVELLDFRQTEVDRTYTMTGTDSHPAYTVVRFWLISQPTT